MNEKNLSSRVATLVPLVVLVLTILAMAPVAASVTDYGINHVVQTGVQEILVEVQANYCSACNPNPAGDPGDPEFTYSFPPPSYPYNDPTRNIAGRFIALMITDPSNNVLAQQKFILTPSNWPIGSTQVRQYSFSGLPVIPGDSITIYAETYCSWCGHWYPAPVTIDIQGSNSLTTYTGPLSAYAGDTITVSGSLLDSGTMLPLAGRTLTFTLDALPPVSGTTDANGVATTSLTIPAGMSADTYVMDTRYAGGPDYWPSSDKDDFEVLVNRPPDTSTAYPSAGCLWPPNHQFVEETILGVTDPDGDPITISILSVTSDEATSSDKGSGGAKHAPDANGVGTPVAKVRAERSGDADGRVYRIGFTADDGEGGVTDGSVIVKVPHDQSDTCVAIDNGQNYDATKVN